MEYNSLKLLLFATSLQKRLPPSLLVCQLVPGWGNFAVYVGWALKGGLQQQSTTGLTETKKPEGI